MVCILEIRRGTVVTAYVYYSDFLATNTSLSKIDRFKKEKRMTEEVVTPVGVFTTSILFQTA
jgi:hypothetical protein